MEIGVAIRWFRERILAASTFLIALRGPVDVKIVEGVAFDVVRALVALTVVAPQAKQLAGVGRTDRKDDREIERVEVALPEDEMELGAAFAHDLQFTLLVASFVPQLHPRPIILR